jgi:hypothetical protein
MPISQEDRARLESFGVARVRLQATTTGFGFPFQISALDWLAELDDAERARNATSQSEQIDIARSAKDAAWAAAKAAERAAAAAENANKRANIALALAAISIVATIILGLLSHFDAATPLSHP